MTLQYKERDAICNVEQENNRVDLATFTIPKYSKYPWHVVSNTIVNLASYVVENFEWLKNCKWEYSDTKGNRFNNIKFNTLTEIDNYVNRVIPRDMISIHYDFTLSAYATIPSLTPTFSKISSRNELYYNMKGNGNYKKKFKILTQGSNSWDEDFNITTKSAIITKLVFQQMVGAYPSKRLGETIKDCMWFSQTLKNMYKLHKSSNSNVVMHIPYNKMDFRYIYKRSTDECIRMKTDMDFVIKERSLVTLNSGAFTLFKKMLDKYYFKHDSVIAIYLLESVANPDFIAFLIKPVGEDHFRFSYDKSFNGSKLFANVKHNDTELNIPLTNIAKFIISRDGSESWVVRKHDITSLLSTAKGRNSISKKELKDVSFFFITPEGLHSCLTSPLKHHIKNSGAKWFLTSENK